MLKRMAATAAPTSNPMTHQRQRVKSSIAIILVLPRCSCRTCVGGVGGGGDRAAGEAGNRGAGFQRGDGGAQRDAGAGGDRRRHSDGALVEPEIVSSARVCGGRAGWAGGGTVVAVHVQGDRGGGS